MCDKIRFILFSLFVFNFLSTPSLAFYTHGTVVQGITFSDLKIKYKLSEREYHQQPSLKYPDKIEGGIRNTTQFSVKFHAILHLKNIFDESTASAVIRRTLPPGQTVEFSEYLDIVSGVDFSDNKLVWEVRSPSKKTGVARSEAGEETGYVISRDLDDGAIVTGRGTELSDRFQLEPGLHRCESEHNGDSNFIVTLLDNRGKRIGLVSNEIGKCDTSKGVTIKTKGHYYLDVRADGNWRVEMINQSIHENVFPINEVTAVKAGSRAAFYKIHLKSGRVIQVEHYRIENGHILFSKYGGDVSLNLSEVDRIE